MIEHNGVLWYLSLIHSNKTVYKIFCYIHVVNCSCKVAYKKYNSLTTNSGLEHHIEQILRALQHDIIGENKSIIGWSPPKPPSQLLTFCTFQYSYMALDLKPSLTLTLWPMQCNLLLTSKWAFPIQPTANDGKIVKYFHN